MYWSSMALLFAASAVHANPAPPPPDADVISDQLTTAENIPELMEAFEVTGLAVTAVSGDKVLLSAGFGMTADEERYSVSTPCGLYSATKVLASLTYANLSAAGRLNLNAPLADYIDDAPETWRAIPFYRLLNHTSGIPMAVNKDAFGKLAADPATRNDDIYRLVRDLPLDYQPGEYSRYRQSGYATAEMILQDKLGSGFDALVGEYITGPAGLSATLHPAVTSADEPAFLLSAGGFQTTANDMSKLFLRINDGTVIAPDAWKKLMLEDSYRFGDYSLGSVIENRNDVLTIGHSGGGARANIRYAPDRKIGVMICTDDRDNNGLAIHLARMLVDEISSGDVPQLPLQVAMKGYKSMTGVEIIAAYRSAERSADLYDLTSAEALLNSIGYSLLAQKKGADAIAVLAFNAETFPDSPNAHDSLGEVLLANGKRDDALLSYRQVLKLDPGNNNAEKVIAQILADSE
ncbi:serine hydrolase [Erythrobacter sp. F6033]|uniref:serine hydrolase n=1 Tax=Erythrobacter sp. F6033 TaxID=2926401 RepID=UPI001FF56AA8|nr:serine hydrolase [Erythrobacter sp. F6033]MCK0129515.1 serine hydrolase [Erythrobacter sp. F6033]